MVNTAPPGLIGYALADRADAVQLWEPAYTLLLAKKPGIRTLDLGIDKTWKAFAGGSTHSLSRRRRAYRLGGRRTRARCTKLYATYKEAADWMRRTRRRPRR